MTNEQSAAHDREQLEELLKDFRTGMFTSRNATGELHSRPLTIADVADDCTIYFPTSISSGKAMEIERDAAVNVTLQSAVKFVSISGRASLSRDQALVDRLWSDAWKLWFPAGKSDPELVILVVRPSIGEYWDQSGTKGIRYLFSAARALVEHEQANRSTGDQHAKVSF